MNNVEIFHYLLLLICGAGALSWIAERIAIPPAVVLLFGGCDCRPPRLGVRHDLAAEPRAR